MHPLGIMSGFFIKLYNLIRSKLSYKLFVIYLIIITFPVAAFSFISYVASARVLERDFINYKMQLNARIMANIDRKVDILLNQSYSAFYILEDLQYALREPPYQFSDIYFQTFSRINSYSLSLIQGYKNIDGVTLIDIDGQVKFHMDTQAVATKPDSFKEEAWFKNTVSRGGGPLIREPHYREYISYTPGLTKDTSISVCRAIKTNGNLQTLGILIFETDCSKFWKDINDFDPEPLEKLVVLGSSGDVIYSNTSGYSALSEDILHSLNKAGSGTFKLKEKDGEVLVNHVKSGLTGWRLVSIMPTASLIEKSRFVKDINTTLLLVIILFILLISFTVSNIITKSLKKLLYSFNKLKQGDFTASVHIKGTDELAQIGAGFNTMVSGINDMIKEKYHSNLLKKQAQLQSLESQINPHFLYNTLSLIKDELSNGDIRKSGFMVQDLSDIFRYSLSRGKHVVKLSDELEHMRKYISIMSERFKGKFTVSYDIDKEALELDIPRLSLQPIVENAINHGFEDIKSGGELLVTAKCTEWGYTIYISDNGKGIDKESLNTINGILEQSSDQERDINQRIGIYNVNARIKLHFGEEFGLKLSTGGAGTGTTVKISLPLQAKITEVSG